MDALDITEIAGVSKVAGVRKATKTSGVVDALDVAEILGVTKFIRWLFIVRVRSGLVPVALAGSAVGRVAGSRLVSTVGWSGTVA